MGRLRPYGGEADLPAIMDLLVRCQAAGYADMEVYSTKLRISLRDPTCDATRLTTLAEDELGTLRAFAALWRGRFLALLAHPSQREPLEGELIAWAVRAARDAAASDRFWAPCRDDDALGCAIYERSGFVLADEELRLGRALDEPMAEPEVPQGFTIRPLAGAREVHAWNALYQEAFGPSHITLLSRHQTIMGDTDYDPALDLVALDADGQLAAMCYCAIPAVEVARAAVKEGRTEPIAVSARYRGRGLGRAMVLHALHLLRERGMKRATLTTEVGNHIAHQLYASLGYRRLYSARWYLCSI